MYSEIASNKRKTFGLISIFFLLLLAMGWFFGSVYGEPATGLILAAFLSSIWILFGYFKGDSLTLISAGAKAIERKDHPKLYQTIENLAITCGITTPSIYIIDDPSANAFATGRDPQHASIAITTGLLEIMNPSELEGVLSHELSHIKNYDIRLMTLVVVLVGLILLASDFFTRSIFFSRRQKSEGESNQWFFLIGIILSILSPLFAQLIKLAISRSREYMADAQGALLTRYPEGLANALEKIATHDKPLQRANHATAHLFLANPFDPHVTRKFELWFSTHPPIEKRIEKLRSMNL